MARAGYRHIYAILVCIADTQGFGSSLGRWIARANFHRIDISAIVFLKHPSVSLTIYFPRRNIHKLAQSMFQPKGKQIVHTEYIRLHHPHRVRGIQLRSGTTSRIHDIIKTDIRLHRHSHIEWNEMIMARTNIRRKTLVSSLQVAPRRKDMIIYWYMRHQQIDQATANQSRCSQHQDILIGKFFPR